MCLCGGQIRSMTQIDSEFLHVLGCAIRLLATVRKLLSQPTNQLVKLLLREDPTLIRSHTMQTSTPNLKL